MELGMKLAMGQGLKIIETKRLNLRELTLWDASFILELLNETAFVRFIGDRGIRNLDDARNYLEKGPLASYARYGFGLWLVQLKLTGESLGICGLIKRDTLPDIDIGYAILERFRGQGYAFESAAAVKSYALQVLNLTRILGITDQDNTASIRVLEKLGMQFERLVRISDDGQDLKLFSLSADPK